MAEEATGGGAGRGPAPDVEQAARDHPTPSMGARQQPPSKRRRVAVVWDETNLAEHSAERTTPDRLASEEQVFFVDVSPDCTAAASPRRLHPCGVWPTLPVRFQLSASSP